MSLTVADDFANECVDIAVDHGISDKYVTRVLDHAACFHRYYVPEFTSRAFIAWTQQHSIRPFLIQHGRPMQSGYVERFNSKFRDKCLNEHRFTSLPQTRNIVTSWRRDYNEVRPHSSCGQIPPAKFAINNRQQQVVEADSESQAPI